MKSLVDEAMRDGAFGLSSMLAMPPGSLATTDDIVELCKVVAKHGGIFSSRHIRNEGTGRASTRSRRPSPSASGPGSRWTSSTSRSPTRSTGAG